MAERGRKFSKPFYQSALQLNGQDASALMSSVSNFGSEYDDSAFSMNPMKLKMFATFAPTQVLLRAMDKTKKQLEYPDYETFDAAVMFADISGFSALADRLTKAKGIEGMELLNSIINSFFAVLVRRIFSFGGDVVKFSGDAMLAIWPVKPGQNDDIQTAVSLATKCALMMLEDRPAFQSLEDSGIPINLQVHIALGAGPVVGMHVGGISERAEYVIGGEPLHQITKAEHLAKAGMLVVSPNVWSLIRSKAKGSAVLEHDLLPTVDGHEHDILFFTPEATSHSSLARPLVCQVAPEYRSEIEIELDNIPNYDHIYVHVHSIDFDESIARKIRNETLSQFTAQYTRDLGRLVWGYTSESVRPRLAVGEMQGQGELRRVTIIFVRLSGLNYDNPSSSVVRLQHAMTIIQTSLADFEGVLSRLQIDDKGTIVKAAFGLPPRSHEDDPARALLASMQMLDRLSEIGIPARIGLATSTVFFGVVGSSLFREISTVGSTVNLAARMMQAANEASPILCEEETFKSAQSKIKFLDRDTIPVKGWKERIHIYFPCGIQSSKPGTQTYPLRGRTHEKKLLESYIRNYLKEYHSSNFDSRTGIVLVEGALGVGKSRLIAEAVVAASNYSVSVYHGSGDEVFQDALLFPWKQIFLSLLGLAEDDLDEMGPEKASLALQASLTKLLEESHQKPHGRTYSVAAHLGRMVLDDENDCFAVADANPMVIDKKERHSWVANPYVKYEVPRVSSITNNNINVVGIRDMSQSDVRIQDEIATLFKDIGITLNADAELVVSEGDEDDDSSSSSSDDERSSETSARAKRLSRSVQGAAIRTASSQATRHSMLYRIDSEASLHSNIFSNETAPDGWQLYLPLLNQLFNVAFPENGVSSQLYGSSRIATLTQYLYSILSFASKLRPILIILEDIQWLDQASFSFLKQIAFSSLPVMMICTRRTSEVEEASLIPSKLIRAHVMVEGLSDNSLSAHICDVLSGSSVHKDLFAYIKSRSKGNPMIAQQIALALQTQKIVENVLGEMQLKQSPADLALSDSGGLQALMTSHINKLDVNQQLTLQVASVIGKVFTRNQLVDIFPQPNQADRVAADLFIIMQARLIENISHKLVTPSTDVCYQFTYVLIHEVCYGTVPFKMRKQLHGEIASWYEKLAAQQQPISACYYPHKGIVARHWEKADDSKKAFVHYEEAARVSFLQGSYSEASHYYEKVISLTPGKDDEEE
eukprot:TRINITY_DN3977_c0_g2_i1.p1 TRINITY_DN3977_c0_g2~~TRINITY_DN3977_c0_g2_i1.p1  ORF type:complete len:1218 (-),score=264.70 TRINITY_DN3977_c0_g2_i1:2201-5854(-)